MSFPGFYTLTNAWFFLLLIPLVIFYFLKLKRPRVDIPSLALWRQVINDRRVNSPFQKFKRNLLLLLQILLLSFLVLAAMQPFHPSGVERAEYLPVLIDCSASMSAPDKPNGTTRLEVAKQEAAQLIENLLPDQKLSLIAVHSTARRLTEFTNNKRILRDALDGIDIVHVQSNLQDGLRMTQALARTVPIKTVVIYSDGNFSDQLETEDGRRFAQVDVELPFELNYQQLPAGGSNLGITAFNARRATMTQWDVFVRVENTKGEQSSAAVVLLQDNKVVAEDSLLLDPGQSQRLVFDVETNGDSKLEVRLKPEAFDSINIDNVAFLALPNGRPLTAFCHLEMLPYRHALNALSDLVVFPDEAGGKNPSNYDLLISDRLQDAALEAPVSLFVGVVPKDLSKLISIETGFSEVIDWERSSSLLQHVLLLGVQIVDEPRSATGVQTGDFEELGYEILAHSRKGPLVLKKMTGTNVAFYVLFHTDRSTLPYRVGFPIFVSNIVQIALRQSDLGEVRAPSTGVLPEVALKPNHSYTVVTPAGERRTVESNSDGVVSGVPAEEIGLYVFRDGARPVNSVGVSLLRSLESSLAHVDSIQFRELSVEAASSTIKNDRPLWPLFALIAFCLLLVEWWYFQRRPGGIPA